VISRNRSNLGSSSWRSDGFKKVNIGTVVICPLLRDIIFVIDSLYWANRFASPAVNALIRVDVKHTVTLIDAINRALFDACLVFKVNAWKCNYISHWGDPPRTILPIDAPKTSYPMPRVEALETI
jgi:hypothetical protein